MAYVELMPHSALPPLTESTLALPHSALPKDMWSEIMQYIISIKDHQSVQLVSKEWSKLLYDYAVECMPVRSCNKCNKCYRTVASAAPYMSESTYKKYNKLTIVELVTSDVNTLGKIMGGKLTITASIDFDDAEIIKLIRNRITDDIAQYRTIYMMYKVNGATYYIYRIINGFVYAMNSKLIPHTYDIITKANAMFAHSCPKGFNNMMPLKEVMMTSRDPCTLTAPVIYSEITMDIQGDKIVDLYWYGDGRLTSSGLKYYTELFKLKAPNLKNFYLLDKMLPIDGIDSNGIKLHVMGSPECAAKYNLPYVPMPRIVSKMIEPARLCQC